MKEELSTRFLGGFLSLSLHLAAGFALLQAWDEGVPVRDRPGGDQGNVLVVELIPLERGSGPREIEAGADGRVKETTPESRPPVQAGDEGDAEPVERAAGPQSLASRSTAEIEGDARELADLPGAEALAYRQRLETHLAHYRIYPEGAREARREGVVMLHFVMTHDGRVIQAWIGESSGAADIDREAVAAVLRAQPLPSFPQGWPGRLNVSLPVTFRLG